MKKVIICLTILCLFGCKTATFSTNNEITNEVTKIKNIEIIDSHEIADVHIPNATHYLIADFLQPVDHYSLEAGTFKQRIHILHRGYNKPVVLITCGYSNNCMDDELARLLDANVISVGHRYYKNSIPDNPDYSYLNLKQAAADCHKIVKEFKNIYRNSKWISTGQSKDGVAALAYKRYYPDDIDAVVAISAPILFGYNDKRIRLYTEDKERSIQIQKMRVFLDNAVVRRDELTSLIEKRLETGYLPETEMTADEILDWFIWCYPSILWEKGFDQIEELPANNASISKIFYHLVTNSISKFREMLHSDGKLDVNTLAFQYQSATELGAVYFEPLDFPKLKKINDISLDKSVMIDLATWLKESGNNIIYIYGEEDMFTSFQVDIGTKTNALKIIQPNAFHSIQLASLDEFDICASTLLEWLK